MVSNSHNVTTKFHLHSSKTYLRRDKKIVGRLKAAEHFSSGLSYKIQSGKLYENIKTDLLSILAKTSITQNLCANKQKKRGENNKTRRETSIANSQ